MMTYVIKQLDVLVTDNMSGVKIASPPAAAAAAAEDGIRIDDSDVVLVGLAVSWENRDAYYVALTDTPTKGLSETYSGFLCSVYCVIMMMMMCNDLMCT